VYNSDLLDPWNAALGAPGVIVTTDLAIETGVDQVNVYLPRSLAVDGKLFARLQVVVP